METKSRQIGFIQLQGEPYQQPHLGVDCNSALADLASTSGYQELLPHRITAVEERISAIREGNAYAALDRKIKDGDNLNFNDAFTLVTFVSSGLNRPLYNVLGERFQQADQETILLQAAALLSAMSTKEALVGLTADEIAGMVAATLYLDTVSRPSFSEPVLAFGGMGGDKGYPLENSQSKLFSLSTLAAVGAGVDGPVHKHHSYPNTSKVAGQSAIEAYGARSDFHSDDAASQILLESNVLMTSCHATRTLHTLSHRLRGETINHVIGPLAFTLSEETPIHALIGVNEKVHPETIVAALQRIQEEGFQQYADSAVFCGTDLPSITPELLNPDAYYGKRDVKAHVRLDEIAPPPYASLVAFLVGGENKGTFALSPADFYDETTLQNCRLEELVIPNTREEILTANNNALTAQDESKARYLAMTIGLGMFVRHYVHLPDALDEERRQVNREYLRACTTYAYQILQSGQAAEKLGQYVKTTRRYAGRSN